jgi:hypothetical protein
MTSSFSYGLVDTVDKTQMNINLHADKYDWYTRCHALVGRVYSLEAHVILEILEDKYGEKESYEESGGNSSLMIFTDFIVRTSRGTKRSGYTSPSFNCELDVYGSSHNKVWEVVNFLREKLASYIREEHEEISWAYVSGPSFDTISIPLKDYQPIVPELYPYINGGDVDGWIDRYIQSKSNVLILNGPMGTGKSSLIGHMIKRAKLKTMVAFDSNLMKMDSLYMNYISDDYEALVLEDADLLLLGRLEKDNDSMSKILNVSEGLIESLNKKMIFTANLGNITDIDPALRRPGRCFDIVEFRDLTLDEANVARRKMGKKEFETRRNYTVAQIYQ